MVEMVETKYYSIDEIAKHDGSDGNRIWIIIKKNVYDVTEYITEHPGGTDVIKEWAGKDATKEFNNIGHSSDAKNKLKTLKVGEVNEEEGKSASNNNKENNQLGTNAAEGSSDIKYYTLEEISKYDGKQDPRTWIIIKDMVYDVTDYLDDHPGGGDLITEWAGKDGTKDFDDFGHSSDAKKELKTLKIGEVVADQRKTKPKKVTKNNQGKKQDSNGINSADFRAHRSCISIITCGILS
uniref:Cytochrome b5 n=1 Tax=Diabrotica virgifera virgifera TaxID=50390 RepID=A0A6P7FDA7_DIAVI